MRACLSDGHFSILAEVETIPVLLPYVYMSMVSSYTVIYGPKAAKRYLLIKSGFFQDEVKKIGPPLFVDGEN